MGTRVLETVLTGRDLLSPMLAKAGGSVAAFNAQVSGANTTAATSATTAAKVQETASERVVRSNTRTSTSAQTSATTQSRAHAQAAESATVSARAQQSAAMAVTRANGLMGTSLTPLTAGLGATGLALGYAAFRGMEFDTSMSRVQAATQATSGDMARLRESAITMGADTQFSAVEAAGGITEMAKAGVSTANIIGGGLKGALDLAAAGEMEVADAAEIGATALNVFRLEGDQMSHVADLLAAGAGKAQGSVSDLGMALNQSALVASATGLSIEETTGSLAAFASAGLIGSDAGTSFRSMLLHLQNPSKEAAGVMADLGVNMYDANGEFVGMESLAGQLQTQMRGLTQAERDKAMATIFGSDAVRAANVLYEQGAKGIAEWTAKVNDAGYASRQAAQLNDNLRGDLERLGGAVDSVFTKMGEGAQGPLRELVQMLTFLVDTGGDVLGFWNSLPGPVQAAVLTLGAVAALKGPVGSAFETIALRAMYARDAMAGASLSAGGFRTAGAGLLGFFGGPWGLAITGAVTGLSLLVSWLGRSSNTTDDAAASQVNLEQAIRATNGALDESVRRAAAKSLQDEGLLKFTELYGVSSRDMVGYVLGEADAHDRVTGSLERYRDRLEDKLTGDKDADIVTRGLIGAVDGHIEALAGLAGSTESTVASERELALATGQTGAAMAAGTAQTEEATRAFEEWVDTLQDVGTAFIDPLASYQALLDEKTEAERASAEETAASTESSSDSWEDYVTDVDVSLDELAARLEEQIVNQENWRANIVTIAQRGGFEVASAIAAMGEEGVDLAAAMANGTDAEFQRMSAAMVREAQLGGAGAATELDSAMRVMAAVGAAGASRTAAGIAAELGIGVDQVAAIAAQYGIVLADGVNPLLTALGQRAVALRARGGGMANADGNLLEEHQAEIAPGGAWRLWAEPETGGEAYIPLAQTKRPRSLNIWRETGKRLGVDFQEYAFGGISDVPKPRSTAPYGPPISSGGDATMQKAYDATTAWMQSNAEAVMGGGPAGSGAVGGAWTSIFNYVKARIPQARANSTFRPGDPGYHGRGKAVDFGFGSGPGGAGSAGLASINRLLHDGIGSNLAELIYDGIGDDRPDLYKGKPHTYNAGTRAEHRNHVHAAVADTGGIAQSGTALLNLSGRPERMLDPRQTEAFERWMAAVPTTMPGYGANTGQVIVHHHHYDESRKTQIDVDARGETAERIAGQVADSQRTYDFLASPR